MRTDGEAEDDEGNRGGLDEMKEDLEEHYFLIFRFWNVVKKLREQEGLQLVENMEGEMGEKFRRSGEKEEVEKEVVQKMEVEEKTEVEEKMEVEEVEERPLPPLHLHPRPQPAVAAQDRGNQVTAFEIPCL